MTKSVIPLKATHLYPGDEDFSTHYSRRTPGHPWGDTQVWVSGFIGKDHWSHMAVCGPAANLQRVDGYPEFQVEDSWLYKKDDWQSWHEIRITYVGEKHLVCYKRHPTKPTVWDEFVIHLNKRFGDPLFRKLNSSEVFRCVNP